VNDKSINVPGGLQRIQTLDGYIILLSIKDGLVRLSIRPYTDHEWDNLPHVILTSQLEWDPSVLDHNFKEDEQWGEVPELNSSFDDYGDYKHRVVVQHISTAKMVTYLMMFLINVSWMHRLLKSFMSLSSVMPMKQNLLSQKVSHLNQPLLDLQWFLNVNLTMTAICHG
jgi:hypothetical protein